MTKKQALALLRDVADIARYYQWQSPPGDKKAEEIISAIHKGKHGSVYGIWPQVDEAIRLLEES